MAQVGQTTPSGGRSFAIYPEQAVLRRVVVPVNCTLNHIGVWAKESTTANSNDLRAAIYTNAGALVYQTANLTAPCSSISVFALTQLLFSGQSLSAGTYILAVSAGPGAVGHIDVQGQNDSPGLPTFMNGGTYHPSFPADISSQMVSDASRQWDIYLDYTEGSSSTTVTPTAGSIALTGLSPVLNNFTNVRYQEVLINAAGSPVSNRTGMRFSVWYSGQCSGAPDLSYSDLTTGAAGTASYSLATGSLVLGQKVFGVITDGGASLSSYTCGLLTLNYS